MQGLLLKRISIIIKEYKLQMKQINTSKKPINEVRAVENQIVTDYESTQEQVPQIRGIAENEQPLEELNIAEVDGQDFQERQPEMPSTPTEALGVASMPVLDERTKGEETSTVNLGRMVSHQNPLPKVPAFSDGGNSDDRKPAAEERKVAAEDQKKSKNQSVGQDFQEGPHEMLSAGQNLGITDYERRTEEQVRTDNLGAHTLRLLNNLRSELNADNIQFAAKTLIDMRAKSAKEESFNQEIFELVSGLNEFQIRGITDYDLNSNLDIQDLENEMSSILEENTGFASMPLTDNQQNNEGEETLAGGISEFLHTQNYPSQETDLFRWGSGYESCEERKVAAEGRKKCKNQSVNQNLLEQQQDTGGDLERGTQGVQEGTTVQSNIAAQVPGIGESSENPSRLSIVHFPSNTWCPRNANSERASKRQKRGDKHKGI
jgi:hypothetical protein